MRHRALLLLASLLATGCGDAPEPRPSPPEEQRPAPVPPARPAPRDDATVLSEFSAELARTEFPAEDRALRWDGKVIIALADLGPLATEAGKRLVSSRRAVVITPRDPSWPPPNAIYDLRVGDAVELVRRKDSRVLLRVVR